MRARLRWAVMALAVSCSFGIVNCGRPTPSRDAATTNTALPASGDQAAPPGAAARQDLRAAESQAGAATTPAGSEAGARAPTMTAAPDAPPAAPPAPQFRDVTVPAGTPLSVVLDTGVSSNGSTVEDRVRGHLAASVRAGGVTALPAGSALTGAVVDAKSAGKVKGRGLVAFRFTRITAHDESIDVRTSVYTAQARATKGKDAKKIGIGAGAGAIVGGIIGGGKGAAIGAGVGGGAGTAVVLSTKGEEAHVPAGSHVRVTLRDAITVRVPMLPEKR